MDKEYYFTDDTWYASNVCSCCDPVEMPCYNSEKTSSVYNKKDLVAEAVAHYILEAPDEEVAAVAKLLDIKVYLDENELVP